MELSLESLNSFRPKTGTLEQWNAAYVRVEDYLRAHRIHNRLHQSRLIQRVLSAAAGRHEQNPALDPVTLAIEETDRLMDGWFAELLDEKDLPRKAASPCWWPTAPPAGPMPFWTTGASRPISPRP